MKKYLNLRNVAKIGVTCLAVMTMFQGCNNGNDPNNGNQNAGMQNMTLTGIVKDVSGIALSGVRVTTGTLNTLTDANGEFSFTQAEVIDNRAIIKFEKSGYFTITRSGNKQNEMYLEVMMSAKGNNGSISLQSDFDAANAQTLQIGGIKIELPASCFVKADGSAYSGTVRADVLNLGPENANTAMAMTGGDLATDKSDEMFLPIGMVDAVFTDNAGNLLKIKENTEVKMTYAAPAGATNLPSSIPLWTFDDTKGIWLEEGTATLQGNAYTGTVSHFTKKGAGRRSETAIMQIHVTECDNKPAAGAKVTFYDVYDDLRPLGYEFLYETYFTNSVGDCSVTVPKTWSKWTVNVSYKGENQSQAFTQGNMGGQAVYFKFNNDCSSNDKQIPEVLAIFFNVPDPDFPGTACVSWDNYGERWRRDNLWMEGSFKYFNVEIYDHLTNTHYSTEGSNQEGNDPRIGANPEESFWIDNISANDNQSLLLYAEDFIITAQYWNGEVIVHGGTGGLTQLPSETVAGKLCNVWKDNSTGFVVWEWKNVILKRVLNGKVIHEATKITENVPASAFTNQTLIPSWIE